MVSRYTSSRLGVGGREAQIWTVSVIFVKAPAMAHLTLPR